MKKFLAVILVLIPCVAGAFFFSPGGSTGGGSTTTDASLLVSGTLPAARLPDNAITDSHVNSAADISGSKLADNTVDKSKIKFTLPTGGYTLMYDQDDTETESPPNPTGFSMVHYDNTDTATGSLQFFDDGRTYLTAAVAQSYLHLNGDNSVELRSEYGSVTIGAADNVYVGNDWTDYVVVTGQLQSDNVAITGGSISGVTVSLADNSVTLPMIYSTGGTASATTYLRGDNTWATPAGTDNASALTTGTVAVARGGTGSDNAAGARTSLGAGTVNGPASATESNLVCWGPDNVTIADCGAALPIPAASGGTGQNSSAWTGVPLVTAGTWAAKTYAEFLLPMGITFNPADNTWTFAGGIVFPSATSTCVPANNNCSQTATNAGSLADSAKSAGAQWFDNTTQCFMIRNNDNTADITMSCLTKTFPFGIDNVIDGDDILLWKVPRAITITQVDCYASTDNVVGVLSECASDNVASCTAVDDTDWTVTNAETGFSVNSGFENPGIAAGAWLKWVTTSEGTTNSNKLSCTVRYTE